MIIRNILLFFLLLTTIKVSYSQNYIRYHSLCNQACKAMEDGQLEQTYFLLSEAFRLVDYPKAADYLNMAKCYSQMNEPDSTARYIELAMNRNPKIRHAVRIHRLWFQPLLGEIMWNELVETSKADYYPIPEAERVVSELDSIDALNRQFYRRYQKQLDPYKPIDTLLNKIYWDSVYQMTLANAPKLDSILLSLSDDLLTNPMVEESFLIMSSVFQKEYWEPRKEQFLQLINRGFVTPDIMTFLFIEEYYGEEQHFNYLTYSPRSFEFYDQYGVVFDHFMYTFRVLNIWKYDEKEE